MHRKYALKKGGGGISGKKSIEKNYLFKKL
jgi:hypothetical protein